MYKFEQIFSPNYTPNASVRAAYGRPRTIEFGAGHWWGDPNAGYSHQGVINTFLNAARQASAHYVISDGRVTQMVRDEDVAWATNNANPFTVAIELKPNMTAGDKETCAQLIADRGWHNLQWKPHNTWWNTGCNPLPWGEIMARAQQIVAARQTPEWKKNLQPLATPKTLFAIDDSTPLRNLSKVQEVIKNFTKGTSFEIVAQTKVGDYPYYLTRYAYDNNTGQGFDFYELEEKKVEPVVPEWIKNLVDTPDVELFVLPAEGAKIYNMTNGAEIGTPIPKGTAVNIAKQTTVGGKKYLISKYAADNAMANGILAEQLGVPVVVPPVTKPEWLQNWTDIADVTMYTRAETPLVNLLTGDTVKMIPVNTAVEIASATEWHGQKYLISKYATEKGDATGMLLVNLDKDPIKEPETPIEPSPEQPDLEQRVSALEKIVKVIVDFLTKLFTGFNK